MAGNNNCATQLLHMKQLNDSAIGLIRNLYSLTVTLWVKLFRVRPELGVVVEQVNGNEYGCSLGNSDIIVDFCSLQAEP